MKVSSLPTDWQTRETANKLVYRVDQKAEYLLERHRPKDGVIEDRYYSSGCGRGFYTETREGNFRLELDPATGKPTSYLDRYAHTEGSYRDEVLSMKASPDGGKTYQRQLYHDGGGQILSQTETVKVSPEGTVDYELKPDSKVNFTNWIRRNRSVETLTALSVGGTLGALAGNAMFGGYGASWVDCWAPIWAMRWSQTTRKSITVPTPATWSDPSGDRSTNCAQECKSVGPLRGSA